MYSVNDCKSRMYFRDIVYFLKSSTVRFLVWLKNVWFSPHVILSFSPLSSGQVHGWDFADCASCSIRPVLGLTLCSRWPIVYRGTHVPDHNPLCWQSICCTLFSEEFKSNGNNSIVAVSCRYKKLPLTFNCLFLLLLKKIHFQNIHATEI